MTILVKDLPKSERPRERLASHGAHTLSALELLAVLISSGDEESQNTLEIAANLFAAFNGSFRELFTASIEELSQVEGIDFVKACRIKAVFELGKRTASYFEEDHPVIATTDDVITLLAPHMMYLKQEEFRVILLDSKNRLIKFCTISMGSLDAALVHPREVFRPAIAHAASSIILVHNHPSGDPTPSEQDILLTRELCMCGKIVGVEVLDHVVVGFLTYVSLKHRELM
jgi:DNA repair protein RadC